MQYKHSENTIRVAYGMVLTTPKIEADALEHVLSCKKCQAIRKQMAAEIAKINFEVMVH